MKRRHNGQDKFGRDERSESGSSKKPWTSLSASTHFNPYPTSKYDTQFPHFRQPREIGSFSQDSERNFQDDRRQLKYYCPPKDLNNCDFDLHAGFDIFKRRDENKKEYLDDLLRWIQLHREAFAVPNEPISKSLNTDFVSWRGLLTKLLCTPYENREGWKIAVTLYNGTYYMCEYDTEERKIQRLKETGYLKILTYGGYKFEQYVTSSEKCGQPNTEAPVNNNEAFCSVVRSRLSKHSLVFGGEVDCCKENASDYVELKTSREMDTPRQKENFKRFKLIKWWAQSFLVGIGEVVCGFRDDDGTVHRLEPFKTLEIPKMVRGIHNSWNPTVCFNFCDAFLQHVKDVVIKDDPKKVYLFEWHPRNEIMCSELEDKDYLFLPDWYLDLGK